MATSIRRFCDASVAKWIRIQRSERVGQELADLIRHVRQVVRGRDDGPGSLGQLARDVRHLPFISGTGSVIFDRALRRTCFPASGRSANPDVYDGLAALKLIEATTTAVECGDEVTL